MDFQINQVYNIVFHEMFLFKKLLKTSQYVNKKLQHLSSKTSTTTATDSCINFNCLSYHIHMYFDILEMLSCWHTWYITETHTSWISADNPKVQSCYQHQDYSCSEYDCAYVVRNYLNVVFIYALLAKQQEYPCWLLCGNHLSGSQN